jgi:hypothetical protein
LRAPLAGPFSFGDCGGRPWKVSDKLNIDLIAAAHEKIEANERKYPAGKVRGSARKYSDY